MRLKLPSRFAACAVLAAGLLAGCVSTDRTGFTEQIHHWVPLGTPVADARRTMEKHKFVCTLTDLHPDTPLREATLSCTRETRLMSGLADWEADFDIRDGKVAAYGHIDL